MSDSIDDGGPAYPVLGYYEDGKFKKGAQTDNRQGWHEGMSLRDFFAGQALGETIIAAKELRQRDVHFFSDSDQFLNTIASMSYEVADAMLAARKGGAK